MALRQQLSWTLASVLGSCRTFPLHARLVIEPEAHRQVSIVTVAGRPHAEPAALAVAVAEAEERAN